MVLHLLDSYYVRAYNRLYYDKTQRNTRNVGGRL